MESAAQVIKLLDIFSANYAQRFGEGSQAPEAGVRINVIRVVSYVEHQRLDLQPSTLRIDRVPVPRTERLCHFTQVEEGLMTRIYDQSAVAEGMTIEGPALVESPRTSYLVEPGWTLTMGRMGSAWLERTDAESRHAATEAA
jgi:N-methylhydantoinase A